MLFRRRYTLQGINSGRVWPLFSLYHSRMGASWFVPPHVEAGRPLYVAVSGRMSSVHEGWFRFFFFFCFILHV